MGCRSNSILVGAFLVARILQNCYPACTGGMGAPKGTEAWLTEALPRPMPTFISQVQFTCLKLRFLGEPTGDELRLRREVAMMTMIEFPPLYALRRELERHERYLYWGPSGTLILVHPSRLRSLLHVLNDEPAWEPTLADFIVGDSTIKYLLDACCAVRKMQQPVYEGNLEMEKSFSFSVYELDLFTNLVHENYVPQIGPKPEIHPLFKEAARRIIRRRFLLDIESPANADNTRAPFSQRIRPGYRTGE